VAAKLYVIPASHPSAAAELMLQRKGIPYKRRDLITAMHIPILKAMRFPGRTVPAIKSDGRKVQGTIHWVSADHARQTEVRLYDHLFTVPKPDDVDEWRSILNPNSLEVVRGARLEPALAGVPPGSIFQFERQGYFCVDLRESTPARLIFNRTVGLRDTWAKIEKSGG